MTTATGYDFTSSLAGYVFLCTMPGIYSSLINAGGERAHREMHGFSLLLVTNLRSAFIARREPILIKLFKE